MGRLAPDDRVDPRLAAQRWCAYAWPAEYGRTGTLTFFIDQDGNDLCVDDPSYSGDAGPVAGAALATDEAASILAPIPPSGLPAQDGNVWRFYSKR